jgi:hypothetical protein
MGTFINQITSMAAAAIEIIIYIAIMAIGIYGTIAIYRYIKENEKYIDAMKTAAISAAIAATLTFLRCNLPG